jgi:hypothetical protein
MARKWAEASLEGERKQEGGRKEKNIFMPRIK